MIELSDRALVFTDLHFGIHSNSQSYIDICSRTLEWVLDCCRRESVRDVIFMGDFFDSRASIDVKTFNFATQSLYAMADGGVELTMILGNHDIYLRDSTAIHSLLAFGGRSGVRIVDAPVRARASGNEILLLPWMYGTPSKPVDVPDGLKYVFSHHNFPAKFFMGGGGRRKSNRSDTYTSATPYEDEYGIQQDLLAEVVSSGGTFFSGHIHQHMEIPLGGGAAIAIEGSPYETSWGFGDAECGAYVVDFAKSSRRFVPNPHNKHHVEVRTSEPERTLASADMPNSIVRLTVDTQETFDAISKLQSRIALMKPFAVEGTKYEFAAAEFADRRGDGCGDGCGKVASKLDCINEAIDRTDFSSFVFERGGSMEPVDKGMLKAMAADIYEASCGGAE